jgi:tyrosine-protein kinase Etk/Wzc
LGYFCFNGLILPAAIIYLKDMLNFKVLSASGYRKSYQSAYFGRDISFKRFICFIVATKPRSMVAEQLRALRTNLNFVIPKQDAQKTYYLHQV